MLNSPQLSLVILISLLFYVIVPGAGAFFVRHRWRTFRRELQEAFLYPPLEYGGNRGRTRFFGLLESVQGEDTIWIREGGRSVGINLAGVPIYLLPRNREGAGSYRGHPDTSPKVVFWKNLFALVEGTKVFVAGPVTDIQGAAFFHGEGSDKPLVIIYDCPDDSVLRRGVWTGRQRNEYWNNLTAPSLLAGSMANLLLTVVSFEVSRLTSLQALVATLLPFMPLLPPGVIGYYFYRKLWKAARRRRAVSDVLKVHAAAEPEKIRSNSERLADAKKLRRYAQRQESVAVLILIASITLNGYFLALIAALTVFTG